MKHMYIEKKLRRFSVSICNSILALTLTFGYEINAFETKLVVVGYDRTSKRLYADM